MAVRHDLFAWTNEAEELAWGMYQDDMGYEDIAIALGCTVGAVLARLDILRARHIRGETKGGMRCSNEQIEDRERRQIAGYAVSDACAHLGDPPPGYSALHGKTGMSDAPQVANDRGKYVRGGKW